MRTYEVYVDIQLSIVVGVQADDIAGALAKAKDKATKQIHTIKQLELNDWTVRPRGIFSSGDEELFA